MKGIEEVLKKIQDRQFSKGEQDGSTSQKIIQCPKCNDEEGFITKVKTTEYNGLDIYEDVWEFCECYHKKKIKQLFQSSKITQSFQRKGFQSFELDNRPSVVKDAYDCAYNYFKSFEDIKRSEQNSIALLGAPGSGKTHLLMAVANNLLRKGVAVMYFPFVEGFNELKSDMDLLQQRMNYMARVPVLFIDDLFKPFGEEQSIKLTGFELKQFYATINYRYLENLPVLISSELNIDQISKVDEAIGSRIYERCKYNLVVMQGVKDLNYRLIA